MTRADVLTFLRAHRYAVQSSVTRDGAPQAAVVGIAVTSDLELIFDTLADTRKAANLIRNPRVAFVIGSLDDNAATTLQYEGVVDQPSGPARQVLVDVYLAVFPDGRERQSWPGLTYFRVRPTWLRYSDFRTTPPSYFEFTEKDLRPDDVDQSAPER